MHEHGSTRACSRAHIYTHTQNPPCIITIANTSDCRFSRELSPHRGNRLGIIIDIFLSDWRRQVRLIRMPGANINSTEAHKRTLEEMVTRGGEGPSVLEPTFESKRDLKISMQIQRIIIPTVRLAPGSNGSPLIQGYGVTPYTVFSVTVRYTVYGVCIQRPGYVLSSHRQIRTDGIQRADILAISESSGETFNIVKYGLQRSSNYSPQLSRDIRVELKQFLITFVSTLSTR